MLALKLNIITKLRTGIISWWALWLFLAAVLYGGLSAKLIVLVLLSLLGFYLGSIPFCQTKALVGSIHGWHAPSIKFPVYALSGIIAYQLYLYRKSSQMIDDLGAGFRDAYFESGIHGSTISFVLYEQFLIPIGIYLISLWVCRKDRGGWWFVFTVVFFLLDAGIKAGRFPLYYLVFFLVIGHLLGTIRLKLYYIVPILTALLLLSGYQLFARKTVIGAINSDMIVTMLENTVLKYHVGGFYMLDDFMRRSELQTYFNFPCYTLGYFQSILSLYLRRFDISFEYPLQHLNIAISDLTYIQDFGWFNAFTTNILPFYLDGGFIFSFVMFYLLGFLLRTSVGSNFQCLTPLNVTAAFVMVFGIFQPIAITGYFYIPVLIYCSALFLGKLVRHRQVVGIG